ncbi:MAG: hypothetical protein PGN26_12985 [Xylophilus ampelinus]
MARSIGSDGRGGSVGGSGRGTGGGRSAGRSAERRRRRRIRFAGALCAGAVLAAGGLYFAGTHHLVAGSRIAGIAVVPKATFSMAEVFVDDDGVRQLGRADAMTLAPAYATLLASQDHEQIEVAKINAQNAGPASEVVPGMGVSEVEALLGRPDLVDRTSDSLEVRHHGAVLILMERGKVLKVVR